MDNKNFSIANICGLAIVNLLLIGSFFQPGEIDIITPSHSDLYMYFTMADSRWLPLDWLYPRFVMKAYLKIAGLVQSPGIFFLLVALPAILFASLTPYLVINEGLSQKSLIPLTGFFFVIFGSPLFYPHFQLDFGGMLGGSFAVLAVGSGLKAVKGYKNDYVFWWFLTIFFCWISLESKPNYSFLLLALAFIGVLFFKSKKSIYVLLGVLTVTCLVYIKDKLIGSPFLAASSSKSPYAVVIDPLKNTQVLAFYIKNAFTIPLALTSLLASIVLIICHEWKLLVLLLVLILSASMPMALLVNRPWDTYAWFSTVIVGVLIMVAISRLLKTAGNKINIKNKVFSITMLFLIFIGLVAHAYTKHPTLEWTLRNQRYNRNIFSGLNLIGTLDERKNLIVGIHGPYHPFRNTAFLRKAYPNLGDFDVLLRKDEREWNEMSSQMQMSNGVYLDKLNWPDYSTIYAYDADGKIVIKKQADEVIKMPIDIQSVFFYCHQYNKVNYQDATHVAKLVECLNKNNEYDSAISIALSANNEEKQPWLYFNLAKSYQAKGDAAKASEFFNKALELEPNNPVFLSAVNSNKYK